MKEKSIILRGHEVRSILDGTRTHLRREVKMFPENGGNFRGLVEVRPGRWMKHFQSNPPSPRPEMAGGIYVGDVNCPFGKTGDRLWVKEAWNVGFTSDLAPGEHFGKAPWEAIRDNNGFTPACADGIVYRATNPSKHPQLGKAVWQSSVHMPRWASRITLEVLSVRVERLNEITLGDITKEGFARSIYDFKPVTRGLGVFQHRWEADHGANSFDDRRVWVVNFQRIWQ